MGFYTWKHYESSESKMNPICTDYTPPRVSKRYFKKQDIISQSLDYEEMAQRLDWKKLVQQYI